MTPKAVTRFAAPELPSLEAAALTLVTGLRGALCAEFAASRSLAAKFGFPVLGSIPLNPSVRVGGDGGDPVVVSAPQSLLADRFREVAGKFAQRLAMKAFSLPILQ